MAVVRRILIVHEKHGTYYLDVSTDKRLHETSVKILKQRLEDKWYGPFTDSPIYDLGVPEDEILDMPEGTAKDSMLKLLEEYKRKVREHQDEQAWIEEVKGAIAVKYNPKAKPYVRMYAWGLLDSRRHCEYERIDLETVEVL